MTARDAQIAFRVLNLDGGEGSGVRGHTTAHPSTMTPSAINKELAILDKSRSEINQRFIDAGRGYEKAQDTLKIEDPNDKLAAEHNAVVHRVEALRSEVARHMGPGYYEFPQSWTRGKFNKAREGRF